ncbi:c-type cytochrome [Pseudochrobactrum sp. MP213Fo]|uniref:cytochrome c n=1 Tax=Pseudochrobactrum sp. MP213Fo TaxID=3022250 RepID=UPI003BA0C7B9
MKRKLISAIALSAVVGAGIVWFLTGPVHVDRTALQKLAPGDIKNGEQVFYAGGCASCHAAPNATGDAKLVLSGGHELKTDFGTFIAPNISPSQAGLKDWTLAEFADAMLEGVGREGEHLYPSFPYTSYARMKMQDVADLYAFMKTLPASDEASKPHDLSFPFNVRRGLGLWKMLYLDNAPVVALNEPDVQLKRGQYLVEAMGHCGECHTPRTMLGGLDKSQWLAGALSAEVDSRGQRGIVPNITDGEGGISSWSASDIAYGLESGFTPDFDSMGGAMTDVIANTSKLEPADREAIAAYLKAIPAHKNGYVSK